MVEGIHRAAHPKIEKKIFHLTFVPTLAYQTYQSPMSIQPIAPSPNVVNTEA